MNPVPRCLMPSRSASRSRLKAFHNAFTTEDTLETFSMPSATLGNCDACQPAKQSTPNSASEVTKVKMRTGKGQAGQDWRYHGRLALCAIAAITRDENPAGAINAGNALSRRSISASNFLWYSELICFIQLINRPSRSGSLVTFFLRLLWRERYPFSLCPMTPSVWLQFLRI